MPQAAAALSEHNADSDPLADLRVPLSQAKLAQMQEVMADYLFPVAKAARTPSELPPDLAPLIQRLGRHLGWHLPSIG